MGFKKASGVDDQYMNFVALETALDATSSDTLVEAVLNTGLSIRGALVWLIHLIEATVPVPQEHGDRIYWCLCTRQGLAAGPGLADDGVVARASTYYHITTEGAIKQESPRQLHYLPPIPIATPRLSLYTWESTDTLLDRAAVVEARMGFTTAPLDAAMYTEIAEAWGW